MHAKRAAKATSDRHDVFADHRRYESVSPTNAYIYANKDVARLHCDFVKFHDHADFDWRAYMSNFWSFRWQTPAHTRNPDCECTLSFQLKIHQTDHLSNLKGRLLQQLLSIS